MFREVLSTLSDALPSEFEPYLWDGGVFVVLTLLASFFVTTVWAAFKKSVADRLETFFGKSHRLFLFALCVLPLLLCLAFGYWRTALFILGCDLGLLIRHRYRRIAHIPRWGVLALVALFFAGFALEDRYVRRQLEAEHRMQRVYLVLPFKPVYRGDEQHLKAISEAFHATLAEAFEDLPSIGLRPVEIQPSRLDDPAAFTLWKEKRSALEQLERSGRRADIIVENQVNFPSPEQLVLLTEVEALVPAATGAETPLHITLLDRKGTDREVPFLLLDIVRELIEELSPEEPLSFAIYPAEKDRILRNLIRRYRKLLRAYREPDQEELARIVALEEARQIDDTLVRELFELGVAAPDDAALEKIGARRKGRLAKLGIVP